MMKAPLRVDTARMVLRRPEMADAPAIFERYASVPKVTRLLGWPRHRTVTDTQTFLQFSATQWQQWPAGPYLIFSSADGRLLGSTGLDFETATDAVTGYVLAEEAWGKGYATEALAAMVGVASRTGVRRLSALCHPDHRASLRVLEKNGFVPADPPTQRVEFPNLLPGVQQDACCYMLALVASPGRAG